jgi:hypothetical protein
MVFRVAHAPLNWNVENAVDPAASLPQTGLLCTMMLAVSRLHLSSQLEAGYFEEHFHLSTQASKDACLQLQIKQLLFCKFPIFGFGGW